MNTPYGRDAEGGKVGGDRWSIVGRVCKDEAVATPIGAYEGALKLFNDPSFNDPT
jgi:hypothetical protein